MPRRLILVFIFNTHSHQKTIEGYESSPKTISVVDHNRGSSGRSSRQIQNYPVTSQLHPVPSPPEIYYGFKPMISEEEERERDSMPGPTEAPLEDFPIPDIGQQLQTYYRPIWNKNKNKPEPNRFEPEPKPVSRPKKSPFPPYVAPYREDHKIKNNHGHNFQSNLKASHLLVEENPNYLKPGPEASRFYGSPDPGFRNEREIVKSLPKVPAESPAFKHSFGQPRPLDFEVKFEPVSKPVDNFQSSGFRPISTPGPDFELQNEVSYNEAPQPQPFDQKPVQHEQPQPYRESYPQQHQQLPPPQQQQHQQEQHYQQQQPEPYVEQSQGFFQQHQDELSFPREEQHKHNPSQESFEQQPEVLYEPVPTYSPAPEFDIPAENHDLGQTFSGLTGNGSTSGDFDRSQRSPQNLVITELPYRGSPESVGYQQITINGVETKYEIPKSEADAVKKRNVVNPKLFEPSFAAEREIDVGGGFVTSSKRNYDEVGPRPVESVRWPPSLPGPFDTHENHLGGKEVPLELPPVLHQPGTHPWSLLA